ncbi:thiazole biosynthesis adenylyltransferase ThiF [Rossellomorea sp. SC111]|uniref:thiazole biosynthesis adenylyltransferase ThiF n=1 Tax=Rossellomorea sp. SC111 TaxID=2968985 RepID=UPI00215A8146|nr:thiazole biosynthesis adenylyltransferase ThiF [Rossellomorea sp. SC111]MCR8847329.1 thiazole biosynthesis adenylyltransferase ThiF [Rossellomorea sp. SC111]
MNEERYSRQVLFSPIGSEGQERIRDKHVLVIGAGALGTGNAEVLVRAGIGKLTIVDRDYVEWSNLQRQQLYNEQDAKIRLPKAIAAKKRLEEINSTVEIEAHILDVMPEELLNMSMAVDLIIDATDNFETRMIINDVSQKCSIPWIYGACVGSYGISFSILPDVTPCLQCLIEEVPLGGLTCDTAGIISPAVSQVVAYQTTDALKILVEDYESLSHRVVSFDLWKNEHTSMDVGKLKRKECLSCGDHRTYPSLRYENQTKTAVLCGRDSVQIRPASRHSVNLLDISRILENQGKQVERNPYLIRFKVDSLKVVLFYDGRALVHGTKEIKEAKSVYHRYFG